LLLAVSVPILAAQRTVTIVVMQNGAPVANARVLVAADEMDAVGLTDAQGRVTVSTASSQIAVVAEKGTAKGSISGAAALLTVTLAETAP
jgi:uncharacterized GH25 family protein